MLTVLFPGWVNCHLLIAPAWGGAESGDVCSLPLEVNGLGDDSDLIYLPSHFLSPPSFLAPWQGGDKDLLSWKVFILSLIFISQLIDDWLTTLVSFLSYINTH